MARSIHTTRSSLRRLARMQFSDPSEKATKLRHAQTELKRKRLIKELVGRERKHPDLPLVSTAPEAIPVTADLPTQWVHHSASVADIRAALALVPIQAVHGLAEVRLKTADDNAERDATINSKRDSWIGRPGFQILPGAWSGETLGTYSHWNAIIQVFAHVYDPTRLPMPEEACKLFLRLQSLAVLMHEVAHHHDYVGRVRRGRWLADRRNSKESYAERTAHVWMRRLVIPYLTRNYPEAVAALLGWVEEQAGIRLPLAFFAGDLRRTSRLGERSGSYSSHVAFTSWMHFLAGDPRPTPIEARLEFAENIRLAGGLRESLQVVDAAVALEPDDGRVLTMRAELLNQLGRHAEAVDLAERIIASDPGDHDAWYALADGVEELHDAPKLLAVCERWFQAAGQQSAILDWIHSFHAVALLALGRNAESEAALVAFESCLNPLPPEKAIVRAADIRDQNSVRAANCRNATVMSPTEGNHC